MKTSVTLPLSFCVIASLVTSSFAQETNHDHLKEYGDTFTGTWVAEWEMDTDIEGIVATGDKVVVKVTNEWTLDGQAIELHWEASINGQPAGKGQGMVGWDRASNEIVSFGFGTFGGRNSSVIKKKGDIWLEAGMGVNVEGFRSGSTTRITIEDDGNTHAHLLTGRMSQDDEPLPNFTIRYRRQD